MVQSIQKLEAKNSIGSMRRRFIYPGGRPPMATHLGTVADNLQFLPEFRPKKTADVPGKSGRFLESLEAAWLEKDTAK